VSASVPSSFRLRSVAVPVGVPHTLINPIFYNGYKRSVAVPLCVHHVFRFQFIYETLYLAPAPSPPVCQNRYACHVLSFIDFYHGAVEEDCSLFVIGKQD
jgi:hypothetical protein